MPRSVSSTFTLAGNQLNLIGDVNNLSAVNQNINLPLLLDGGNRGLNAANGTITVIGFSGYVACAGEAATTAASTNAVTLVRKVLTPTIGSSPVCSVSARSSI